jgi:hypothetical protein
VVQIRKAEFRLRSLFGTAGFRLARLLISTASSAAGRKPTLALQTAKRVFRQSAAKNNRRHVNRGKSYKVRFDLERLQDFRRRLRPVRWR